MCGWLPRHSIGPATATLSQDDCGAVSRGFRDDVIAGSSIDVHAFQFSEEDLDLRREFDLGEDEFRPATDID
jgi:hypothetical protein